MRMSMRSKAVGMTEGLRIPKQHKKIKDTK